MDDLTTPFKAKKTRDKTPGKSSPGRTAGLIGRLRAVRPLSIVLVLLGIAVFTAGAYVRFAGSPLGGEPVGEIALEGAGAPHNDMAMKGASEPKSKDDPAGTDTTDTANTDPDPSTDVVDTGNGGAKVIIIRPEEQIRDAALPPVPDSRLVERTDAGILPKRSTDGATPAVTYARQYNFGRASASDRPRIAILVNGMGLNAEQTSEAIRKMPAPVSFAFAPYGTNLQKWVSSARQAGHEVMLQVPMEPFDYPDNDPGPHTLLTSVTPAENLQRLHWAMTRMVGYTGLTNYMGARFTASREVLRPALLEMKKRGLLYIDDGTSPRSLVNEITTEIGLPARTADVVLDAVPAPDAITAAIERLEVDAFQNGLAVGVISDLPVSINTVSQWLENLDSRGIDLIPVSASTKAVAEG